MATIAQLAAMEAVELAAITAQNLADATYAGENEFTYNTSHIVTGKIPFGKFEAA